MEIDAKLKAIELDIDQTKCLIEEQKALQNNENNEKCRIEKIFEKKQENREDNEKKIAKIVKETKESFLSTQSLDERQTQTSERGKSCGPVATYPVDENIKANQKGYECYYGCRIF